MWQSMFARRLPVAVSLTDDTPILAIANTVSEATECHFALPAAAGSIASIGARARQRCGRVP
jgi:hypothetical protein